MAYKIAVDNGHGMETAGKRTPPLKSDIFINGKVVRKKGEVIHEKEWNRPTADYLIAALRRCKFEVLDVAPGLNDIPVSIRYIAANDWKADLFVSKHYNAADGVNWDKVKPTYTVTFIAEVNKDKTGDDSRIKKSKQAGNFAQNEIVKANLRQNNGVVSSNSYGVGNVGVLKNTNMPAYLTESGFMDVWSDAVKMLDPIAQQADAEATCRGICSYFSVPYIAPCGITTTQLGTVNTGLNLRDASSSKGNIITVMPQGAQVTIIDKESNGWLHINYKEFTGYANGSYITIINNTPAPPVSDKILYRVQAGAYTSKENANVMESKLKNIGYNISIIKDGNYYKVQTETLEQKNAIKLSGELKSKGFSAIVIKNN